MPGNAVMLRRSALVGDPGFGALIPLAIRGIAGAARLIGRARVPSLLKPALQTTTRATLPILAGPGPRAGLLTRLGGVARAGLKVGAAGAGFEAGGMAVRRALQGPSLLEQIPRDRFGGVAKRRRMNPLNPRALSRATRRLAAFNSRVCSTQAQLARLAAPSTRRRCPPRRKPCR